MKLTKLNHSTLLINYKDTNILFDPGDYSIEETKSLTNLDLLIITHTHLDHLHMDSVKIIIQNNPQIHIIGNSEVASMLEQEGIKAEVCEKGQSTDFNGIKIQSYDFPHVTIWKDMQHPQNTGYVLDNEFYTPGDSYGVIEKKIKVCAFMITGPACKVNEALEFAIEQKPGIGIGIHDGMLNRMTGSQILPTKVLPEKGVQYFNLELGKEYEF